MREQAEELEAEPFGLLDDVVAGLNSALGTELALVGVCRPGMREVDTLAAQVDGEPTRFAYAVAGSPCAVAVSAGTYAVGSGVVDRFPNDRELRDLELQSYVGARFDDPLTGQPGVIAVASRHEIVDLESTLRTLRSFAAAVRGMRENQSLLLERAIHSAVVDTMPAAVVVLDREHRVVRENPSAASVLDLARHGSTFEQRLGPTAAACLAPFLSAIDAGQPLEERVWFRMHPDEDRPKLLNVRVVDLGLRGLSALLARDVTDQALEAERLKLATQMSGFVPWDWSIAAGDFHSNNAWSDLLGLQPPEGPLPEPAWRQRIHPKDLPAVEAALARGLEPGPGDLHGVYRLRHADGHYVWVESHGRVVERDECGRPLRAVGCTIDVDGKHQAQLEASRLGLQLQRFVEHTPAAVGMMDADLRYLVVSQGWCALTGLEDADVLCRRHGDVFPQFGERWNERLEACLNGESLEARRDLLTLPSGQSRWVHWKLEPWRDEAGEVGGCVVVFEDVSELIADEAELSDALDRAERANRAKSDFVADISHEIRTPLNAVLGFADLLRLGECDDAEASDYAATIERNARHLVKLVDGVLDLSKIEADRLELEPRPTALAQLIIDTVDLFRPRADERGIGLSLRLPPSLPAAIQVDPTRLRQVLSNLISNAVKFTSEGEVAVTARFDPATRELGVTVRDTGIGMDADQCARIFDRYSQAESSTTRRFGGTGLGLAIAHRLADRMGGGLAVDSEVGRGTAFTLRLASVETCELPDVSAPTAALPASDLGGTKLLLAEDGVDNQRLIGHLLRRAGATVEVVGDGRSAVDAVLAREAAGEPFDAVLMDVQMPHMDGYEATEELRRLGVALPIAALTAHTLAEERARAEDAGCTGFISKPVGRVELIAAVRELVGRGSAERSSAD